MKSISVSPEDLKKINLYTRREMKEEELYVFKLRLCDNEVDRDGEAFTADALRKLSQMFVGKTGIFDHNPKGENQTARIFDAEVVEVPEQKTVYGENYVSLNAKAYMVRNERTADLILDLDAGIKKEVSVSCSMEKLCCSVCGTDWRVDSCGHRKGEIYGQALCYGVLDEPTDAYEWSFVAIPAQRNAGVIKNFLQGGGNQEMKPRGYENLKKAFAETQCPVELSVEEARLLSEQFARLEQEALVGKEYLNDLRDRVAKMSFLCGELIDAAVVESVVQKMNLRELKAYESFYEKKLSIEHENGFESSQLMPKKMETEEKKNQMFKI